MTTCCYPATSRINSERTRAIGSWPLAKTRPWVGNLRKPEKIKAKRWASECSYASERVHIRQKKFLHNFRYSARTRVIVDEKSVRIVQRMKNPAARFFLPATREKRTALPQISTKGEPPSLSAITMDTLLAWC